MTTGHLLDTAPDQPGAHQDPLLDRPRQQQDAQQDAQQDDQQDPLLDRARQQQSKHRDPLLEPFELGGLTLRNRIVSASHEPAYTEDGMPKDRYRLYHREKARGGVGLTMIGGSAIVSQDSPAVFGNIDLRTDEVVPWLAAIADDCHDEGAAVMIQATHLGMRSSNFTADWLPLVAPTRTREPAHRSFTKAIEDFDEDRIVADFAAAAARVAAAGFDGLEIMHAGHLLDAFLAPWLNGHGSTENTPDLTALLDFPLRVIDAVRSAVPQGFLVGIRMAVDELRDDGMREDRATDVLTNYTAHGIDFLNLNVGTIASDRTLAEAIPGMGTPSAPWLEVCRRIRQAIDIPVLHAARIADVPTARYAIEDGCLDLVGMTRAQLADPHLVRKIADHREDDIRPCVGANMCLDGIYTSGSATCIHNPASGREADLPHEITDTAPTRKHVVIVGAGPAGLEAARVAAVRGHRVTVFEADSAPGGQVRVAARSQRRRDLIGIVDWRVQQCAKHGVDLRLDTYADAEAVLELAPEVVIVATGGVPEAPWPQTFDVWDVMDDHVRGRHRVLVFDDHGAYPALDAVERLARQGQQVTYVSPERTIGIDVGSMNSPAYLRVFSEFDVDVRLGERLIGTQRSGTGTTAVLRNEYSDRETAIEADAVVIDCGTVPNDEVYRELRQRSTNRGEIDLDAWIHGRPQPQWHPDRHHIPGADLAEAAGSFALYRIGDAVASRNVHAAVLEGLRMGMGL